jgi:hypothetical protein
MLSLHGRVFGGDRSTGEIPESVVGAARHGRFRNQIPRNMVVSVCRK